MYQYFIWNGVNSLDMGVVMLKAPSIFIPQRKVNEIKVSGRNGELHKGCRMSCDGQGAN